MKGLLFVISIFSVSCIASGQAYITYKFGDGGQIKVPHSWTIFDEHTDQEIMVDAVIASEGRYQTTPGKKTIIRSNGYKDGMTFTLKLSYTLLEESFTVLELRSQKDDIIELLNDELVNLKSQVAGSNIRLVKAFPVEYKEIGGGIGGKLSFIKQQGTSAQRKIVQYMLFKDNKMYLLTLGWDVSDENQWINERELIISSLKL